MRDILQAPKTAKKRQKNKAQGTLEFALASGVFLMLVFAIIEFGYFLFTYGTVFSAAREAARYGSSVTNEMDCAGIKAAAVRIGGLVGVSTNNTEVRYDKGPIDTRDFSALPVCPYTKTVNSAQVPATELGDRVVVRISMNYHSLTGVFPSMPITNLDARTIIKAVGISANFPTPQPVTFTPTVTDAPTETAITTVNANATATAAALMATAFANTTATMAALTATAAVVPACPSYSGLSSLGNGKYAFSVSPFSAARIVGIAINWSGSAYLRTISRPNTPALWSGDVSSPGFKIPGTYFWAGALTNRDLAMGSVAYPVGNPVILEFQPDLDSPILSISGLTITVQMVNKGANYCDLHIK